MKPISVDVATTLWTRFRHTGEYCQERWIHEAAVAAGVELPGHSVADSTPTLVQNGSAIHAIHLSEGRPLNVIIGQVVHETFVPRSA